MIERGGEEFLSNKAETFQILIPYLLRFLLNIQVGGSVSLDNKFGFHGIYILSSNGPLLNQN